MTLQRKILCITNAALLSASVYASAPDANDVNQVSVPAAVGSVDWTKAFKTVSLASVCSGTTYWALNEINRRMNMGIQNPYITSVAAVIAVVGLYGGELCASVPTQQNGIVGAPATGVEDASPSRTATSIDIDERLSAVETATGPFSNARNHAAAYITLKNAVTELNRAVGVLKVQKDKYKQDAQRLQKDRDDLNEKLRDTRSQASGFKVENIQLMARTEVHEGQLSEMAKTAKSSADALIKLEIELKHLQAEQAKFTLENALLHQQVALADENSKKISTLEKELKDSRTEAQDFRGRALVAEAQVKSQQEELQANRALMTTMTNNSRAPSAVPSVAQSNAASTLEMAKRLALRKKASVED